MSVSAGFSINISKSSGIHIGSNIVLNYNASSDKSKFKGKGMSKKEFVKLFAENRRVTRDDIGVVSKHLDEKWKDVGRQLDYTDGQLAQFELNYGHLNISEVCR